MASGVIQGTTNNQYIKCKIEWSSSPNVSNNTSTVTAKLYYWRTNTGYTTSGPDSYQIKIGVQTSNIYSPGIVLTNSTPVLAMTYTRTGVPHNADGTLSVPIEAYGGKNSGTFRSTSCSGTAVLDTIPRQANITSAPNFTDQDNPTIKYSNPAGNAVSTLIACISLTGTSPDIAYRNISKTGTSYTFSLTSEERNLLRNATTNGSRTIKFLIRTVIGSNTFYSEAERTFTVKETSETKPGITMSISANNGSIGSVFNGIYIQGKSKVDVTLSAQPKYNATITSYLVSIDGKNYTKSNFTSEYLSTGGNKSIVGKVTDSRKFTNSVTKGIYVYSYSKPTIGPVANSSSVQCYRSDTTGNQDNSSRKIWVKAKRNYSKIAVDNVQKNFCVLQWRYKLESETWGSHPWNTLISRTSISTDSFDALIPDMEFPITNAYTIQLSVVDDLGEHSEISFDIPTDDVPFHLGEGGKNVSVGRYCDYTVPYTFDVEWSSNFHKNIFLNSQKDNSEHSIRFYHCGTSGVDCMLYGGSSTNSGVVGLYDITNKISPWYYDVSGNLNIGCPMKAGNISANNVESRYNFVMNSQSDDTSHAIINNKASKNNVKWGIYGGGSNSDEIMTCYDYTNTRAVYIYFTSGDFYMYRPLRCNDAIYESGERLLHRPKTLWSGSLALNGTATMNENFSQFSFIAITVYFGNQGYFNHVAPTNGITLNGTAWYYIGNPANVSSINVAVTMSSNTLKFVGNSNQSNYRIIRVSGIR